MSLLRSLSRVPVRTIQPPLLSALPAPLRSRMKSVLVATAATAFAAPSFTQWAASEGKEYASREELVLRRVSSVSRGGACAWARRAGVVGGDARELAFVRSGAVTRIHAPAALPRADVRAHTPTPHGMLLCVAPRECCYIGGVRASLRRPACI